MICFYPGMCYPHLWERSCFVEDYECEGIMCVSHCSRGSGMVFLLHFGCLRFVAVA